MKKRSQIALLLILLSGGISLLLGLAVSLRSVPGGAVDLQDIYYATKCVIQHHDPYQISDLRGIYVSEEKRLPPGSIDPPEAVEMLENLPTIFVVVCPIAILPWRVAFTVWMALLFGGMVIASFLMWRVGSEYSPSLSLLLICILLSNMEIGIALGNAGILVVGLSVTAAWCLVNQRFVPLGVAILAIGLLCKPHLAGLIWLYFLISGGVRRKQALQCLAITTALGLVALSWISHVSRNWFKEWHENLSVLSAPGQLNDPGPTAIRHGIVIDLQAVVSVFRDTPSFYNAVTYLLCGALLLIWSVVALRYPFSKTGAWFALAAIVPLTLLVTYHHLYDSKLLLLTLPACSILCSKGGRMCLTTLAVNIAGFILTGAIPFALFQVLTDKLHVYAGGMHQKLLMLLLARQVSIVLLAMAFFNLWVFVRNATDDETCIIQGEAIA